MQSIMSLTSYHIRMNHGMELEFPSPPTYGSGFSLFYEAHSTSLPFSSATQKAFLLGHSVRENLSISCQALEE